MCLQWIHWVYPAWSSLSFLNLQVCVLTHLGKFSAIFLQICFRHGPFSSSFGTPTLPFGFCPSGTSRVEKGLWPGPQPHSRRRVDWMVPGEQVALWTLTGLPFPIKLIHVFPFLDLK